MKANVYIDGFNLYYGALKGTPCRWLDVGKLCSLLLPGDTIHRIRYYTAYVQSRPGDPGQQGRQRVYLRALRTTPNLSIHFGHFLAHPVSMPLASKPTQMVKVIKTEEKGSDVNLASHLLMDGFRGDFDIGVVVSNDSDLLEPIRIVKTEIGKPVGILNPHRKPSVELRKEAKFMKPIRAGLLAACQFPALMQDASGTFKKPSSW